MSEEARAITEAQWKRLETFEPQGSAQNLLALHLGCILERDADAFPEWPVLIGLASDADLAQFCVALEMIHHESQNRLENQPFPHTTLSHTTRARASWGLEFAPKTLQNLREMTTCAPLFVRRRAGQIARLTARTRKAPSLRDEKRIENAWRQIRDYARRGLAERESAQDKLVDEFWSEIERLDGAREKATAKQTKCGARCRSGKSCEMRVHRRPNGTLAARCRLHGGASTGPKTEAGSAAIAESNRKRGRENLIKPEIETAISGLSGRLSRKSWKISE